MPKQTTFVIGSLTGRADLLSAAFREINVHATQNLVAKPTVVLLGDYIDHGPDAKNVLDILMANPFGFDLIPLRGDHEDRLLDIFAHDGEPRFTHSAYIRWIANGGMATLQSFLRARQTSAPLAEAPDEIILQLIDDRYLEWIANLSTSHTDEIHFFSHAGINPDLALEEQTYEDLVYGTNSSSTANAADFEQILVHTEHLRDEEVLVHPNKITVASPARRRDVNHLSILMLEVGQPVRTITAVTPPRQVSAQTVAAFHKPPINISLTTLQ